MSEVKRADLIKVITTFGGLSHTKAVNSLRGAEDRPKVGDIAANIMGQIIIADAVSREEFYAREMDLVSYARASVNAATALLDELDNHFK